SGNTWRVHYTVDSFLPDNNAFVERRSLAALPKTYLEVKGVQENRLAGLLHEITAPKDTPLVAAQKIEAALRKNYAYTLDLGKQIPGNPIDVFLFERKAGHCEYFAAAMCLLLRERGIPARMVTGFVAHEWNARGGYYIVRMRDAHAWVEADIPNAG